MSKLLSILMQIYGHFLSSLSDKDKDVILSLKVTEEAAEIVHAKMKKLIGTNPSDELMFSKIDPYSCADSFDREVIDSFIINFIYLLHSVCHGEVAVFYELLNVIHFNHCKICQEVTV